MTHTIIDHESEEWVRAHKRVTDRRDFGSHVVVFVVVNAFVILVWAMTDTRYFWPAWIVGPWGIGLVLHGWEVFVRRPVTDQDVEEELQRSHR
jgi:hypothetical protein